MIRIDAHQHFWTVARGDYGWLSAYPEIARDFLPDDLLPLLAEGRIDRTILVQAAPVVSETEFLLEIAERTPFVAGVVGWVALDAPDAPSRIARLAAHSRLVGLRPMLQDLPDDEWLLRPELVPALDAMKRASLCFDALVQPRHLPALTEFVERNEELPVVIDHGAKPDIARNGIDPWARHMRHIGRNSRAVCKFSGLLTEAGPDWSRQVLEPYVDVLLEFFGPQRLMWGSDWPVLNLAGDYSGWLDLAETLTKQLTSSERDAIFGGTAASFYGLS
jgi:L-fuconolactonase